MFDLQSMMFLHSNSPEALMLGGATYMFIFDLVHSRLLKEVNRSQKFKLQIPISYPTARLKLGRMICCGHTNGMLTLRDNQNFNIQASFQAFTGGITDLDIKGDLLLACGWSKG